MDTTSLQIQGGDYKNVCGRCSEYKRQWHFSVFHSLGTKTQNQPLPLQIPIKQLLTALPSLLNKPVWCPDQKQNNNSTSLAPEGALCLST